ncbi:MAG: hypothetical protein ABIU95_08615 [Burkholderiales bacterium]
MTSSTFSTDAFNAAPPSRRDNPFATCWTKPGALAFHFSDGESAEQLVSKLAAQYWQGAIIGPHGSGKSTLLESLKPALAQAGQQVLAVSLHDRERRLLRHIWNNLATYSEPAGLPRPDKPGGAPSIGSDPLLLIIDGYEQLGWLERRRLLRHCRRTSIGLLVTAHAPARLPTLAILKPDRALIAQLVADLCAEVSMPITPSDVAASHACHGSNVREIFFDLYDRHERKRRTSRTGSAAVT